MRTIETDATVTKDGRLVVEVPPDVPPGQHHVKLMIEEPTDARKDGTTEFLVIHVDSWPDNLSLSREDIYGDEGR